MSNGVMLATKLYRILLRGGKEIYCPRNKEFLHATISSLESNIVQFSDGQKLVQRLRRNPKKAIRKAFLIGHQDDIDNLLHILPRLNRFFRASKMLEKFAVSIQSDMQQIFHSNVLETIHNIGKGALLVSKLHYTEKALKERDVDKIFWDAVKSMAISLKSEINRLINEEGPLFEGQLQNQSLEENKRTRIFTVILALDRLIKKREEKRIQGNGYVHLVDQVLEPHTNHYLRATPIVYSSIYCTLVNYLDLEVEAYGVSNPKHFLSRMSIRNTSNGNQDIQSPIAKLMEANISKSKGGRITFSSTKEIHVTYVPGPWMRIHNDNFSSSILKFDRNSSTLSAYSENRIIWQLQIIGNSRPTNFIKVGQDYIGEYFHSVDGVETMVPCTIKFYSLSTDMVSFIRGINSFDQPYVEIEVCYKESLPTNHVVNEGSANIVETIEHTERSCRMSDLDWCLLDFSDKGVTPITPIDYLDNLKRQGHGKETVRKLLQPVTSVAVAARMAGNLSRNSAPLLHGVDRLEDGLFWMSVRKQLEHTNSLFSSRDTEKENTDK